LPIRLRYYTDPACSASWAAEPRLRLLLSEFGGEVEITYVMGGLAREFAPGEGPEIALEWLEVGDSSGMPVDARPWLAGGALRSSFPACMAVKAAAEQGAEATARYLRALREGIMCGRRRLDAPEPLVEEARAAGLDAERFRVDVGSHAIVEAFGADLEEARTVPESARAHGLAGQAGHGSKGERLSFPTARFTGTDGEDYWRGGDDAYDDWRAAALAAGARPRDAPPPDVLAALRGFGPMAAAEVALVCGLPGPRAQAELWRLASEWRARPARLGTGELWQLA